MSSILKPVRIVSLGRAVPETVISNDDLTKILDTSDEWITTRTGIKERRICSGNETAVDLGVRAAQEALDKANMKAEDIDLIIAAASAPTNIYPSTACEIQAKIGARNVPAFDMAAACTGMIYAMVTARAYISSGAYKNILIVATDANSRFVDWSDRSICVLFGDGAGAMILSESDDGIDDILSIDIKSDGAQGMNLVLPLDGENCPLVKHNEKHPLHIKMNGKEIYKFVVKTMPDSIQRCLNQANLEPEDIDYLVPHQANLRIIEGLQQRLKYDDNKVIFNIHKYGNTSAASVPIALSEAIEEGKVKLPSTAILCAFGGGLTWGSVIVKLRKGIY